MQVHSLTLGAFALVLGSSLPLASCSSPKTPPAEPSATRTSIPTGPASSETNAGVTAIAEPAKPSEVDAIDSEAEANLETGATATAEPATPAAVPVAASAGTKAPAAQTPAPQPTAQAKAPATDSKTSIFGEPLYVNGKRISDDDIKLYLIYGPGRMMLELYRVGVIVDDQLRRTAIDETEAEIARRAAEKPFASPTERKQAWDAELVNATARVKEKYALSDQDFQDEYDETIRDFHEKFPVLDVPAEISRAFRSVEWYRVHLRQTLMFDRVFLPENPVEWPVVTLEAVRADSGDILVDDAHTSYKSRLDAKEKNGLKRLPKEDSIYVQMMRGIVRDALFTLMDFKTQPDAPPGIAFWADTDGDGKPEIAMTIEELWNKVEDTITPTELNEAKQWFVTSVATRDRQIQEGILISDQDCRASIHEFVQQFSGTYLSLETLATKTYYFPSIETYKEYYCLFESYKRSMEPKLKSGPAGDIAPPLRGWFDRANRIMGLGQIDCEVMMVSALDVPHFTWKPNGWAWAEKTAREIKAKIDANTAAYNEQKAKELEAKQSGTTYVPEKPAVEPYRFWSQMMDNHSEYWDPPPPEVGRQSDVGYKKKGRFGLRYRNDLIGFVGETYYTNWATGNSLTDYMFFDQGEGTVAGPFKGPQGWYLTRVNKRTPPSRPLNLSEPKHVQLLKDDYLRASFIEYAKEAAAEATVQGFTP